MKKFVIALFILALPPAITFLVMSQPEKAPFPPSTIFSAKQIEPLIGVYEIEGHDRVLATYSARGGIALFGLNGTRFSRVDYLSSSITPTDAVDVYRWVPFRRDALDQPLILKREAGVVIGFTWPEGSATRIDSGFSQREIQWMNGAVQLTGTLFLPDEIRHGGAVILHGSGWSDRDNLWYLHFVMALVESGVAVLFPDKRGSGKSQGDWRHSSMTEFAEDGLTAREQLARYAGIKRNRIGLIGISQGGTVAIKASGMADDIPWIIDVSGSNVKVIDGLIHETYANLRQMGIPGIFDFVMHPYALAIAKRKRSDWWRLNGDYDPLADWQRSNIPTLVIYGREDEHDNVPVAASIERFNALGRENVRVDVYENVGHGLFDETSREIVPEVVASVADWAMEYGDARQ